MAKLSKKELGAMGSKIMREAKKIAEASGKKTVTKTVYKKPWKQCVKEAAKKVK